MKFALRKCNVFFVFFVCSDWFNFFFSFEIAITRNTFVFLSTCNPEQNICSEQRIWPAVSWIYSNMVPRMVGHYRCLATYWYLNANPLVRIHYNTGPARRFLVAVANVISTTKSVPFIITHFFIRHLQASDGLLKIYLIIFISLYKHFWNCPHVCISWN